MTDSKKDQVGVIPYSVDAEGKLNFVLVTPKYCDNYWIFPKGNIEMDLGPKKSALAEAHEEAGLKGSIKLKPKVQYKYEKYGTEYIVDLYIMKVSKVLDSWDEVEERERIIVKSSKAEKLITDKSLLKAFRKAHKIITAALKK